jgi:putative ATP-binding cassette transporter
MCILLVRSVYIAATSTTTAVVIASVVAVSIPLLRRLGAAQSRGQNEAADAERLFLGLIDQLMTGFNWFKLDRRRREDLAGNFLKHGVETVQRREVAAGRAFAANSAVVDILVLLGVGAVVYLVPFDADRAGAAVVITLILASWPHVTDALLLFPTLTMAATALEGLTELEARLLSSNPVEPPPPLTEFRRLSFTDFIYEYRDDRGALLFRLGPLDLTIERGETLFIVGGNGSGKSTMSKVISGLYPPTQGRVLVDGGEVEPSRLRGLFGGVFSDYHLFERLYRMDVVDTDRAERLLETFGLSHVTMLRDGRFPTRDLSSGQRKRLALIIATLENRPILIYDEWASDQDPEFRDFFYSTILPEQRAAGTTVIAISHDDRFFDRADRIVELASGRIIDIRAGVTVS